MQQINEAGNIDIARESSREFPSRPDVLSDVRRMIDECAGQTTLSRGQTEDLLTAADEAAANAIRHGSPKEGPNARLRITCQYTAQWLEIRIRDFGRGFAVPEVPTMPAPDAMGGRGLPLMVALADSVAIASSPEGTTVTLVKRASGNPHG